MATILPWSSARRPRRDGEPLPRAARDAVRSCLGIGRQHNVARRVATERHDADLDASMTAGDLLGWLGPHGPAAVAATSVFGSFMFVEQIVSDEAKAALARQLKSFD